MSQDLMDSLRHAGLLHWTLWKLETLLEKGSISVLLVRQGEVGDLEYRATQGQQRPPSRTKQLLFERSSKYFPVTWAIQIARGLTIASRPRPRPMWWRRLNCGFHRHCRY